MASTHGDHTVKITSCGSGHLLQTLEGHPRTPGRSSTIPTFPTLWRLDALDIKSGCGIGKPPLAYK
jgi:activator-of-BECN1-regulated-autophagy protein 1